MFFLVSTDLAYFFRSETPLGPTPGKIRLLSVGRVMI